jgi:predicted transposase YbfD/YdcC
MCQAGKRIPAAFFTGSFLHADREYDRNRKGHGAENMAIPRHMAVNSVRKEKS